MIDLKTIPSQKILVTGSAGFISGYLVEKLLALGHKVVGLDNFSKYGRIEKSYQKHPNYRFVEGDARDARIVEELLEGCDHFVAAAARIGGISYFHEYAFDLLADNELMMVAAFRGAISRFDKGKGQLKKITVLSSSMVYENATVFPSPEGHQKECPPPFSTYGFQKLACEYFAKGAWEQYQLPYTICRPFNCVGVGERRAVGGVEVPSGNVKLAMSHVVPDLVQKVLKGQDPIHLLGNGQQVRCYTYGGDLADGIIRAMFDPKATNEDFNLSTPVATTVIELADAIWKKIKGNNEKLRYTSDDPYPHDVQRRVPNVEKAKRILGFEAKTSLDEMLDEVIPWLKAELQAGRL